MKLYAVVVLLYLLGLSYGGYISSCSTISSNGYFVLTSNLSTTASECLRIENITFMFLNCDSYYLSTPNGVSLIINNASNLTLWGCYIKDSSQGVEIEGSENLVVKTTDFYNTTNGIVIRDSTNITLSRLDFNSVNRSIYVENGSYIYVKNSSFYDINESVFVNSTQELVVDALSISGGLYGVYVYNTSNFILRNVIINDSTYAVYLNDSTGNITTSNISSNTYGIYVESSANIYIFNNILSNNANFYSVSSSNIFLNTTKRCFDKKSITKSLCWSGNFWGNSTKTEHSDVCIDLEGDGICDSSYGVGGFTDYLPLSKFVHVSFDTPLSYDVNQTTSVVVKGNAYLMPYNSTYSGNLSLYVDGDVFLKNVSVSAGEFYDSFVHLEDKYYKNLYMVGWHSSGKSNNTFYFRPSIFSLGVGVDLLNTYLSSQHKISVFLSSTLRIIFYPFSYSENDVFVTSNGIYVKPSYTSIAVGVSSKEEEEIVSRITERFYKKDYCYFTFDKKIESVCLINVFVQSPLSLVSSIPVFGEGTYYFVFKRQKDSIAVSIQ